MKVRYPKASEGWFNKVVLPVMLLAAERKTAPVGIYVYACRAELGLYDRDHCL